MGRVVRLLLPLTAAAICFLPGAAYAQFGNIAGIVRDSSGGALPGVTVEVTSPSLIEKVRSTVTDNSGRYQIVNLPIGVYRVTFKLDSFGTVERTNVELSSDFTAPVNAEMKVGTLKEVVNVTGDTPTVDVQNARQRQVFTGEEVRDLPTTRNLSSLIHLIPGISLDAAGVSLNSVPTICSGGAAGSDGGTGLLSSTSGGLSGCSPILGAFNSHASMNDIDSLNQGRIQVDGLGVQSVFGGGRSSYLADVASAQEITFTLSGSLGESETGGATINIVPRTGGNRYAGQYYTSYAQGSFYGKNNDTRRSAFTNRLDYDYDVNGSYGGPIMRDRLWFHTTLRQQSRANLLTDAYRNQNEGIFGANYYPDTTRPVYQNEVYRNANLRLTVQASQKNKFNIFWDEQFTCENPCEGTSARTVSAEAAATIVTYPIHLAQITWNNPLTNKILLDGRMSWYSSHVDQTKNRYLPAYPSIPRVAESGTTTPRGEGVSSGSINDATYWNNDNIQSAASVSYVTGSHNVKLGYQGAYLMQTSSPHFNDMRLSYSYATPASTCVAGPTPPAAPATWCGLSPFNPGDPYNMSRAPIPTTVTQYIPTPRSERAWYNAFYLQDQWTWGRFTLNGALRYDQSQSRYLETCVGPDIWLPRQWCVNDPELGDGKGVNFQDLTPRWGVAWDVFGNGKTAIKWNMSKGVSGAGLSGIYIDPNVARRTIDTYARTWSDTNGNRIPDCDLTVPLVAPNSNSFPNSGECGAAANLVLTPNNTARRFGRSPDELDEANQAIGLGTTQCGRTDSTRIPQAALDYCAAYGDTLLSGWGKRGYNWQLGIGVQHELLPRLSMEVTYNRRWTMNQTITDAVGVGCDLYNGADPDACIDDLLNFKSNQYDFFALRAPVDPRLPDGGGYLIQGYADEKPGFNSPTTTTNAITLAGDRRMSVWHGVDVNFTLRARGGLRLSGGTSTGARDVDDCRAQVNNPPSVVLQVGGERTCAPERPLQTNVRGSASYTIPWVDVLFSTVFSYRPGSELTANYQYNLADIVWLEGSEYRATNTTDCGTMTVPNPGCLTGAATATTVTRDLLANDTFGELAKNIRFAGNKRVNIGADVYNVFNSDAALGYCGTYPQCGAVGAQPAVPWAAVNSITTPRFVRFQVQFDF
jgi:Carboxypeptidase regulatory-like domain